MVHHHIPITGSTVRVPSRRVSAHFKEEVECQIQQMLQRGIIEESTSSWMSPAVFVRKKSGDIHFWQGMKQEDTKGHLPFTIT